MKNREEIIENFNHFVKINKYIDDTVEADISLLHKPFFHPDFDPNNREYSFEEAHLINNGYIIALDWVLEKTLMDRS